MNTDKRVEALEQEIALLKAQIQTILLDIQEQLLTNAYPTLRAEDVTPPQPPNSNFDNPNVRKVTSENFQGNNSNGQARVQPSTRQDHGPRDSLSDDPDQTRWQNPLRQMHLTEDPMEEQDQADNFPVVRNVGKAQRADVQHYAARPAPQSARQTEVPYTPAHATPTGQPKKPVANESRMSQPVKAAAQPSVQEPSTKQPKPKTQPKSPPKKAPQSSKLVNKKPQQEASKNDNEPQKSNMVLRLIAGVQNAGAGITRKKNNYG
ncbi:MAG: hypothetical protein U0694_23920 [Anaerolineae bacterium]